MYPLLKKHVCFPGKGCILSGRVSILKLINVSRPTSMIVKCPTFGTDKYYNINKLSVFCPIFREMGQWDTWDNLGHLGQLGQLGQLGHLGQWDTWAKCLFPPPISIYPPQWIEIKNPLPSHDVQGFKTKCVNLNFAYTRRKTD